MVGSCIAAVAGQYAIQTFSYDAPLARLDYWSDQMRNGDVLMADLEIHQQKRNNILVILCGSVRDRIERY